MKSGTTTLETVLAQHPDISVPVEKETTVFNGSPGARDFAARLLEARTTVAAEVSTGYMQHPWVTSDPGQAVDLLGDDLRVIAVLREPLSRAKSHWRHWEQLGRNIGSMHESLTDRDSAHLAFSRYAEQLGRWAAVLPEDHILVLRLEDYELNPSAWQSRITDFLAISPFSGTSVVRANTANDRVVSRGASRRVSQSTLYRRWVRPLVPAQGRRAVAQVLGAKRGGGEAPQSLSHGDVQTFYELVHDDAQVLQQSWPHAVWDTPDDVKG